MSCSSSPPTSKRLKIDDGRASRTRRRLTSEVVLRQSRNIHDYLNITEVLSYAVIPGLDFLEDYEMNTIWMYRDNHEPSGIIITRILSFLKSREASRKEDDFRKFVACVNKASAHRGHEELGKIFTRRGMVVNPGTRE